MQYRFFGTEEYITNETRQEVLDALAFEEETGVMYEIEITAFKDNVAFQKVGVPKSFPEILDLSDAKESTEEKSW